MIGLTAATRIYLYRGVCDMRKSFDGLCGIVRSDLDADQPTVSIGEGGFFYKAKGITKILKRRAAANTRKWLLKQARHEK